jgi:hypothetical protein
MKKKSLLSMLMLVGALITLPNCGGGGGGGGTPAPVQPTTAVLTLSTTVNGVMPANTIITGYDVTITLPAGVTVKSTTPPQTDSGVVTATGVAAGSSTTIAGVYAAAAGATPGKVRFIIANGSGFSAGEFCKVTCDIAAGYNPSASAFTQPTFAASGLVTSPTTSTVDLTGQMTLTGTAVVN